MLINFMWPLLPQMQQFCLFTRPFIWKVAATVYITHYKKLSSTTFSIKFSNSTLVYRSVSSISHKIWILKAQNFSVWCKTFWAVISGIPTCKLWSAIRLLQTTTTWQSYAFNIIFWCAQLSRWCVIFHTSLFLNWLKQCRTALLTEDFFHMHASNCEALLQNSCSWPTKLLICTVLLLHTCHQSDHGKSRVYDSWKHIMHIHAVCTRRCVCTFKKTLYNEDITANLTSMSSFW